MDITPSFESLEEIYKNTLLVEKRIKRLEERLKKAKNLKPAKDLSKHMQGLLDILYKLDEKQIKEWKEIVSGNTKKDAVVAAGLQYLEGKYAEKFRAKNLDITPSFESLEEIYKNTLLVKERITRSNKDLNSAGNSKPAKDLNDHIQGLLHTLYNLNEEQRKEWKEIVSGNKTEDAAVAAEGLQYLENIYAQQPGAEKLDITPSLESLEKVYQNTLLVEQRIKRFKKNLNIAKDSKQAQDLSKHIQGLLDTLHNLNEEQIKKWKEIVSGDETEDVTAAEGLQYLENIYAQQLNVENLDITLSLESLENVYLDTFLVEQKIKRFKNSLDKAFNSDLAQDLSKNMQGLLNTLYNLNEEQKEEWKKIVSDNKTEDAVVAEGLRYLARIYEGRDAMIELIKGLESHTSDEEESRHSNVSSEFLLDFDDISDGSINLEEIAELFILINNEPLAEPRKSIESETTAVTTVTTQPVETKTETPTSPTNRSLIPTWFKKLLASLAKFIPKPPKSKRTQEKSRNRRQTVVDENAIKSLTTSPEKKRRKTVVSKSSQSTPPPAQTDALIRRR